MSSHDPTEVYAARDEIDATLVQAMLAEAGIEARIVGGQIMGAVGEVPAGLPSAPRVWVAEEHAEEAKKLIRQMEEKRRKTWQQDTQADDGKESDSAIGGQLPASADQGSWECQGCHETVTVDFEICWNCQRPRVSRDFEGDATAYV